MKINNSRHNLGKKYFKYLIFLGNILILKNNFKTKLGIRNILISDNIQLTQRT